MHKSDWGNPEVLGRHHISTLSRYWLTRLYLALSIFTPLLVTWLEPDAITHKLILQSGETGPLLATVLAGVCVLAVFDVIVNDLMPDRFTFVWAKSKRHLVYMALAMGTFSMTYVYISVGGGIRWLVIPSWVDGSVAAVVAFLDLFNRHRTSE